MAAEWVFSITQNTLTSPLGMTWSACSGGLGEALPCNKRYTIETLISYGPDLTEMRDFRDRAGHGWWCPITPQFATSRHGFGIHPDGGSPGTRGCIGITDFDTSSAKRALQNATGQTVHVIP